MKYSVADHHNMWQWEDDERKIDNPLDADIIFMWNDFVYRDTVRMFQDLGKKVIVFEHGYGALTEHESGSKPMLASGYMTLGQYSKDSLVNAGFPEERILVTGNPVFDDIKKKKKETGRGLYVALHWVSDVTGYNNAYASKILESYPDYKWDAKTSDKLGCTVDCMDKWTTSVDNPNSFDEIKRRITDYDIVMTPKAGTFDLFAKFAGIPVYVIDEDKSYIQSCDPQAYAPKNNVYLKIGEKMPKHNSIKDLDYEIKRPSLSLEEILQWASAIQT